MKRTLLYIGQILQAIGRIAAGLAMLHYRAVFWTLRAFLFAAAVMAVYRSVTAFTPWILPGCLLAAVGAAFTVKTHRAVMQHPITEGKLLTGGTFAVVRHPMYSGMALLALALALIARTWWVTVLMAIYALLMLSFSCAEDEENAEIFGSAYRAYSRRVWLSGIIIGLVRLAVRPRTEKEL